MPPYHNSAGQHLVPIAQRPTFTGYLGGIWRRRHLALTMPLEELRSQHLNTALGQLWHLLNPALLIAMYYLIFGLVLSVDRGVDNYIAFLAVGIIPYHYSQRTILAGSKCVTANLGLIQSIAFPRLLLPLSTTIGHTLAFIPALAVMLAVCIVMGIMPEPSWLLLGPLLVVQALLNLGFASAAARLGHRFRDIENILPFLFRLLFYGSGILYSVDYLISNNIVGEGAKLFFELNPFYGIVALARWAILSTPITSTTVLALLIWTLGSLTIGTVYFTYGETDYGV